MKNEIIKEIIGVVLENAIWEYTDRESGYCFIPNDNTENKVINKINEILGKGNETRQTSTDTRN